jgi:hypothetical protein
MGPAKLEVIRRLSTDAIGSSLHPGQPGSRKVVDSHGPRQRSSRAQCRQSCHPKRCWQPPNAWSRSMRASWCILPKPPGMEVVATLRFIGFDILRAGRSSRSEGEKALRAQKMRICGSKNSEWLYTCVEREAQNGNLGSLRVLGSPWPASPFLRSGPAQDHLRSDGFAAHRTPAVSFEIRREP